MTCGSDSDCYPLSATLVSRGQLGARRSGPASGSVLRDAWSLPRLLDSNTGQLIPQMSSGLPVRPRPPGGQVGIQMQSLSLFVEETR